MASRSVIVWKLGYLYPLSIDLFNNEVFGKRYIEYMNAKGIEIEDDLDVSASTDMGNISYVVPSLHPVYSIGTDAYNHTAEFSLAARTTEAHQKAMVAAVCLSMTAVDASLDATFFQQALDSFKRGKQQ